MERATAPSPTPALHHVPAWDHSLNRTGLILEAWSEGWFIAAMVMLAAVTIANMTTRPLHVLILIELIVVMPRGTIIFFNFPNQNWLLSSFDGIDYSMYLLHGFIAWLKVKPFLPPLGRKIFLGLLLLTIPYWILLIYANFQFFNHGHVQPWTTARELMVPIREPFWIFAGLTLIYNIKSRYNFSIIRLVRTTPRFGVMLVAMFLSIAFALADMSVVVHPITGTAKGVNPFWKLARTFCCLTDVIILDDFKTALDRIRTRALSRSTRSGSNASGPKFVTPFRSAASKSASLSTDIEKADSQIELTER